MRQYDLPVLSALRAWFFVCKWARRRAALCLHCTYQQCSGWGLFLDLGAPLANLTGTLPRLGSLRAPDGLLTWPDLTCSTLPPLPFAPATLHFTMEAANLSFFLFFLSQPLRLGTDRGKRSP